MILLLYQLKGSISNTAYSCHDSLLHAMTDLLFYNYPISFLLLLIQKKIILPSNLLTPLLPFRKIAMGICLYNIASSITHNIQCLNVIPNAITSSNLCYQLLKYRCKYMLISTSHTITLYPNYYKKQFM